MGASWTTDSPPKKGIPPRNPMGCSSSSSERLRLLVWLGVLFSLGALVQSSRIRFQYSYADVRKLGNDCRNVDSCGFRRTSGSRGLESPQEMNCACDYLCEEFQDCCIDAPKFADDATAESSGGWKCYELRQFGGVYMKNSCSRQYSNNQEVIDLCENSNPEDFSDPMSVMPVTDSASGFTYRNFYCGACNGKGDNLVFWTPRLECPTLTLYNSSRKNLTYEHVLENLVFDGVSWGIYLDGDNGTMFFHDCMIDPVMPQLLESKIRLCKGDSVSECAKDWLDEDVRLKCGAYTGMRYYHSESYRNVHCAMCNRVNVSLLTCQPVEYREMIFRTFAPMSFSLLLDFNEQSGHDVGLVEKCNEDELFDPFFKKCRRLICLPGSVRKEGKCVPEGSEALEETTTDLTTSNTLENVSLGAIENSTDPVGFVGLIVNTTGNNTEPHNSSEIQSLENEIGKLQKCSLISLLKKDYIMYENKTIYVPEYDRTYDFGSYFAIDGSVLICPHFDSDQDAKFSPLMGYITVVGLGISMLCLFLHFLTFCVVPDLQNLSGKNLMSQCVSLFFAYCCLIVGQGKLSFGMCTAAAFFTFYFFQASFFWMSIMAFDVWRTLKMATTELRVTSGKQMKRFILYSLYSWVSPLLLLALVTVAEYTSVFPEEYRPRFAKPRCWFKSRRALMCFFAAPLFAVILSNVILYASSAKMIIMTTKTTVKQQNPSQKRNFKLYLRLFILMGLTWAAGLVAGWVDSEVLWYFFVVLNTLQGLFIFLSFTCSSKVLAYLRDRASKFTKTSDFRSSATHSTSHSGSNTNSTTALK